MYSEDEINAAIVRVERAKQNNPVGWAMLDELGLDPSGAFVVYAFQNANAHMSRLAQENDHRVIYATGWLQGLAIGQSLQIAKLRKALAFYADDATYAVSGPLEGGAWGSAPRPILDDRGETARKALGNNG